VCVCPSAWSKTVFHSLKATEGSGVKKRNDMAKFGAPHDSKYPVVETLLLGVSYSFNVVCKLGLYANEVHSMPDEH